MVSEPYKAVKVTWLKQSFPGNLTALWATHLVIGAPMILGSTSPAPSLTDLGGTEAQEALLRCERCHGSGGVQLSPVCRPPTQGQRPRAVPMINHRCNSTSRSTSSASAPYPKLNWMSMNINKLKILSHCYISKIT